MPSFAAALVGLSLSGLLLTACSVVPRGGLEAPAVAEAQGSVPVDEALPSQSEILAALATAQVVYLAEIHTSEADHAAQLQIIQALYESSGDVAIALEMFQRPFQPVLDAYLAGEISEAELIEQSEYETRWGFPWELYAPILRYAQANQIPLIALNTPAEITRKVSRNGLASLNGDDLRYIPPLSEVDTKSADYQAFFAEVTGFGDSDSPHGGHGGFDFDNFFAAQVLWDETMAAGVATFAQANPETTVVVLAGQGHVVFDFGIPSRVQRRLGDDLVHYSVILTPSDALAAAATGEVGDFLWPGE
ncbi:MAG: ChaN family lipoprotein [Cyanobacteria bacterium J06632_22]